ncbi:MAG: DEAD/DEAH box helicase family protein [Anaerolineae bacterium]|nr:DEAD/DEAH box helicase family protein [Anaerolineae bacterium]
MRLYGNASFPPPRPFQDAAHEQLRQGIRGGHRCQMLMAPTGAGKTYLGLRVIHEALERGKRAIFVCDRTTLIDQTSATADRYGLSDHGVIQANHWRLRSYERFQIASAQTLARRKWPEADVIVVDEAHTQLRAWTEHIASCKAAVVGLSATPFAPGLGRLFSNLVNAATMRQLIADEILVPLRVLSCTPANMEGAATFGGEWTDTAAEERGMEIVGDVVSEWIKFAENRKTIVFGATIKHCEELARQFTEAGVAAAVFTSGTTDAQRERLLADYRGHDSALRVLTSVEALAKGFDVPDVSCVVDCRPLRKSLSTAIQMWGRGLRASHATSKRDCLLLDHSGNIVRFRKDFEATFHDGLSALDAGEKLNKTIRRDEKEQPKSACPSCGYQPFYERCMGCGFERKLQSLIEHLPGEMREIRIGSTKYADDARHLWEQACTYARTYSQPEKQQGRAAHIYREIAGSWPPRGWQLDTTPDVQISRAVLNKIKAANIAFSKRREAA